MVSSLPEINFLVIKSAFLFLAAGFLFYIIIMVISVVIVEKFIIDKNDLTKTPENERIVLDYLRNNNIWLINPTDHEEEVKEMPLAIFRYYLNKANNSNNSNRNTENESISDIKTAVDYIRRENAPVF